MRAALQTFFDANWGWLALIALLVIVITCLIVALFAALRRAPGQTLMSMGTAIATALGSAFVFSVLVILFSEYFKGIASFKFIVPVIFIFIAIGVFLMLLLHYASVIMEKRPGIETAALGLPEGSMRAFLALALIVLVGVFGSFIFFETRSTGVLHSVKQLSLSDEGAIQVRQNLPSGLILVDLTPVISSV